MKTSSTHVLRLRLDLQNLKKFFKYLIEIQEFLFWKDFFLKKGWNCLKPFILSLLLFLKKINLKYTVQANIKCSEYRVKKGSTASEHPIEHFQRMSGNKKKNFKI